MLTQLALLCAIAGALTRTSFAAAFADDDSLPNQASSSASAPTAKLISPITSPTDASGLLHERLTCSSYLYAVLPTNVTTSLDATSTTQFPFKADIVTEEARDSASHWEWIRVEPCGSGIPEEHYLLLPSPARCTPSSTDLGAQPPSFRRCRDILAFGYAIASESIPIAAQSNKLPLFSFTVPLIDGPASYLYVSLFGPG